jgi:hypothetical protein
MELYLNFGELKMALLERRLLTVHMKLLLDKVEEVYGVAEGTLQVHQGSGTYNSMTDTCISSPDRRVQYMGWSYGGWAGCCGYCLMAGFQYKTMSKGKASILAKAFKKYCQDRYGPGASGWTSMFHAVSEQERGYQQPFLRAAGFRKAFSTVSSGTQHKLTTVVLDLRTADHKERAEDRYEERYGDSSVYSLGAGT